MIDRRSLFQLAGAAALLRKKLVGAQAPPAAGQPPAGSGAPGQMPGGGRGRGMGMGNSGNPEPFPGLDRRATVALVSGEDRRKNMYNALMAIDKDIQAKLKGKKYVVIKPNFVSTVNQLAALHVDAARGILDYMDAHFKGTVVIAESSAGDTNQGYDNFKYRVLPGEYKKLQVQLIDLNDEAKFERVTLLDKDLHIVTCRLAARLMDPEAFVVSAAMFKTHNTAIATLSIKNMVLGAPLHNARTETTRWNEKRKYHVGLRQTHYNMMMTAAKLNWHLSAIDGFEGMEGNGPASGTPVPSRVAVASTDFVAADRTAAECMSIDPEWLGYLKYSGQAGLGQFDPAKIDVVGAKVADVKKPYRMHDTIEQELKWQGPMTEVPFNLGWTHAMDGYRMG
jgi:uncharacterized protein (DUF362 family)